MTISRPTSSVLSLCTGHTESEGDTESDSEVIVILIFHSHCHNFWTCLQFKDWDIEQSEVSRWLTATVTVSVTDLNFTWVHINPVVNFYILKKPRGLEVTISQLSSCVDWFGAIWCFIQWFYIVISHSLSHICLSVEKKNTPIANDLVIAIVDIGELSVMVILILMILVAPDLIWP